MSSTRSKRKPARPAARTSPSAKCASRRFANTGGVGERTERVEIVASSGNIFADLGFPPEEAESLLIRAELMRALEREIARRKLTQTEAAALFGVTQPRINDLVRRKIGRFSIDTLVDMLARAGVRVRVDFTTISAA